MRLSKQARRSARELFRSCLAGGLLDEDRARQAVQRVLAARPRGYLPILMHFQHLVKLDCARRSARVESAAPLSPELRAGVQAGLSRLYGPGLEVRFAQNPALIGGMRVRVGSDVYDGSVQGRLAALEESF